MTNHTAFVPTLVGRTGTTRHGERVVATGAAHDPARVTVLPAGADPAVVETFTPRVADVRWDADQLARETLAAGDVIYVADVPAGPRAKFPAHFAVVWARTDGTLGTMGVLGGGATYGTLPRDGDTWGIVGNVDLDRLARVNAGSRYPMDLRTAGGLIARRETSRQAARVLDILAGVLADDPNAEPNATLVASCAAAA